MAKRNALMASAVGTMIEYYDFFIYGNAAVLVFPKLFFPGGDETLATLQSLATFALAFLARPLGASIFGHFGDWVGRKATLIAALLTMGLSTVAIGLLPTYDSIGITAALLLALCRVGQGIGLGGEWGGAVLLATENAGKGNRAWYGMFPQLGSAVGFILAAAIFIYLDNALSDEQFLAWGWRIPFIASVPLIALGLYVRLKITETPEFQNLLARKQAVKAPLLTLLAQHQGRLLFATLMTATTFAIFYLMSVFTLQWATTRLGFAREEFLVIQIIGVIFLVATVPMSAFFSARIGGLNVMLYSTILISAFGLIFGSLFGEGTYSSSVMLLAIGFACMGLTYGSLGTVLSDLFPAQVRYTGSSLAFTLAGIIGGSVTPYIALALADDYGIAAVGFYLTSVSAVSIIAILFLRNEQATLGAGELQAARHDKWSGLEELKKEM